MRVAPPVFLSEEQQKELGKLSRGRRTAMRVVERARIILVCVEGKQKTARSLSCSARHAGRSVFGAGALSRMGSLVSRTMPLGRGGRSLLPKRWFRRWCEKPRRREASKGNPLEQSELSQGNGAEYD